MKKLENQQQDKVKIKLLDVYQIKIILKKHYILTPLDLRRQKESNAAQKAIQQIEFYGQLKKLNNDDNAKSMLVLIILGNIKETRLKLSQVSVTVL